ncbi:MAG: hypothetical protein A2655_04410 [Candidatus Yanofskybacteria bacterium RIFCSPHIGHO2_01_FULL_43_42]|uniref:FAD dependent oxidoreductase domain-containing protein n=1 Tax=Candidatus Yanofskybacteria bacterium RIFCSPLOWO2_01_FULL_43_22 TaxID=1802695 RepID=A0A1F8GDA2_9BACT|nr:MAG: hypothetical protein A2655_04410 [Candidatus Yanofskybacteria bacterium RIFCSPHIGHO2_01_FULL_43_42]OGN13499.1 MAG: hypothetical protein A3D48_01970 [Candidatus Yanofskybacteria bacterium RIFCSPHIGHO2_02_FULL_43_17]OGN23354.1 MAG: hypothetical protein A3A13_04535 [Candidatus Yanofskybacteria bacterium RIFCSPLOWO2_01_FULL_43_22]
MEKADLIIIGGGVIGCATARQAALDFPHRKIIVLEKNSSCGLEASGRNSEILHSGFHHRVGSLKEKLANKGSKMAKTYARENRIPLLECGMLIVIPRLRSFADFFTDLGLLKNMCVNSRRQNLRFSVLSWRGLRRLEPNIEAVAGIFLPDIAVIDSVSFVEALRQDSLHGGVKFSFGVRVESIKICRNDASYGSGFIINDQFVGKSVINCAGIYADEIAAMAGSIKYRQYAVRGEYYQIIGAHKNIVSRLISPAVPPGNSSKGILFSPRPDGKLFLGPSFKSVEDKLNYEKDKTPPEDFLKAVKGFAPDLTVNDLEWSHSGIRAKLNLTGDSDFVIRLDMENPALINNIGIDSPGLSSSMAIAEMNCRILREATRLA